MHEDPGIIQSLTPIIILFIPLAVIGYKMARRRGRNGWAWALLGLLPYFNFIFLLYLASQPEQWMVDRLDSLENRLDAAAAIDPQIRPAPAATTRPAIL